MRNQTDTPSQIRFGAANTNLFEGTQLHWIDTLNKDTWQVKLAQLDFGTENLLNTTSVAVMNPSFPFIAAPFDHFQAFKNVV